MKNVFKFLGGFALLLFCGHVSAEEVRNAPLTLDMAPAQWIWYPSGRTLQNTFILFRKEIDLPVQPQEAKGWILADSRYQLFVNGKRVQWGPAPSDPRWQEADPVDLTSYLKPGKNVIACQVLYYGQGDGTWPMGKPGFIMNLDIDGTKTVTDASWDTFMARSWKPGQYKRWFLRALQEEFDARIFPYGWNETDYELTDAWQKAQPIGGSPSKPSVCNNYSEYQWEIFGNWNDTGIRQRSIPLLKEYDVPAKGLAESMWLIWKQCPETYFEMVTPGAYETDRRESAVQTDNNTWEVTADGTKGAILTFELPEQIVGWPYFTIDAPEGTTVELLVHEAHAVGGPSLINTHFNAWSRFICKAGINHFETFDFEGLRWIQLHIRNFEGTVKVNDVGVRRRIYDWPVTPKIELSDTLLQKLMGAAVNTLNNSAQETVVDGMGRERQQYSGDGGHQLHALYEAFGETRLPARFMTTFSQGASPKGYFMDSWPAYDRLARVMERQLQLTGWGPILDHSVGFCFDNFYYYLYTGDKAPLKETYPRLVKFYEYLTSIRSGTDNLLPVADLGTPSVWIDHEAYKKSRHKQLAFNLYVAAMCENALSALADAMGEPKRAKEIAAFGASLRKACVKKYWDPARKVFVNNLPWEAEEGETRYCDRSLATSVLFDQCPGGATEQAIEILSTTPAEMGLSYPCNAVWRLWALVKARRMDAVLNDLRNRWGKMGSIDANNTLQEFWEASPDSWSQWSHCAVAPLIMLYQGVAGVKPLDPGYGTIEIAPQFGDLTAFDFDVQTVKGAIGFRLETTDGTKRFTVKIPEGTTGELVLDARETVDLPLISWDKQKNLKRYRLTPNDRMPLTLKQM